jgi:hypothetical protein
MKYIIYIYKMEVNIEDHFNDFLQKYHRKVLLGNVLVTYTSDVNIEDVKNEILNISHKIFLSSCERGKCEINAGKIYNKMQNKTIYLVKSTQHSGFQIPQIPEVFKRIYGNGATSIGSSHHVLPYFKIKVYTGTPEGEKRFYIAVETTEQRLQCFVTRTETELLQMLKERYLFNEAHVTDENPNNIVAHQFYISPTYSPDDSAFGGTKKRKRKRKIKTKRRTLRNLKKRRKSFKR